ncbi:MAG: nucleotidyl transferase AbiEii/AbiGii toxin family protein [Turicibacter sp.]|nr:nucleotidyl transferase AbiEii/AbiGii toxin family protein [Turicibacter sp.]
MLFKSPTKLKDWIKNKSKQTGTPATMLMRAYMMERFLERVALSEYREHFILKGGFLIASMIGIDKRTTMDLDATIKGLPINRMRIEQIVQEIIGIDANDAVTFEVLGIKNIREESEYDDFRISLRGWFFKLRSDMKIDITIGDLVIPSEIEYPYPLMFEGRSIPILAYNLYTILSEKMDSILTRNITNTRARDFYDIYVLVTLNQEQINRLDFQHVLTTKMKARGHFAHVENHLQYLVDISSSPELRQHWLAYTNEYDYAREIGFDDILPVIGWLMDGIFL